MTALRKTAHTACPPGLPCAGFALFPSARQPGEVETRTVVVTGTFPLLGSAQVTESATRRTHVLPLERVCSGKTLEAKRLAYSATLSAPVS